jgi:NTP pyrophosphatase (non-canonical NTP hydrolase)
MTRGREDYVNDLRDIIRGFIEDRDWEQFHSPKNLAMALSVEVAEVVEHFQWLTEEQSQNLPPEKLAEVRQANRRRDDLPSRAGREARNRSRSSRQGGRFL